MDARTLEDLYNEQDQATIREKWRQAVLDTQREPAERVELLVVSSEDL